MKNKKRIIGIVLFLMLLISGVTVIYADEIIVETTELLGNLGIIEESSDGEELLPMTASKCCHSYTYTSYSGGICPTCQKSVSGTAKRCSKCGEGWLNLTCGHSFPLED